MSFRALHWAKTQRVGHQPTKHLLLLLAEYADEREECFPSQERIAAETEMAVRSVHSCLTRLDDLGLVERRRERRADGTLGITRYRLRLDRTANLVPMNAVSDVDAAAEDDGEQPPERRSGGSAPPERHDTTTGTSCRSSIENPYRRTPISERDARASAEVESEHEPDGDSSIDELFDRFMNSWPSGRTDNRQKAFAAWSKLSQADQRRALEGIDAFRVASKAAGRKYLVAAGTYLADGSWRHATAEADAPDGSPTMVAPFTRTWWFLFHGRREARQPVRVMIDQAASGRGYSVPASALPTISDEQRLRQVATDSAEWLAYRDELAMAGTRLPDLTAPYAWVPDVGAQAREGASDQPAAEPTETVRSNRLEPSYPAAGDIGDVVATTAATGSAAKPVDPNGVQFVSRDADPFLFARLAGRFERERGKPLRALVPRGAEQGWYFAAEWIAEAKHPKPDADGRVPMPSVDALTEGQRATLNGIRAELKGWHPGNIRPLRRSPPIAVQIGSREAHHAVRLAS